MKVHKKKMSMLNNGCLAGVVWLTISRSAGAILSQTPGSIFSILAAGICVHIVFLTFNGTALWLLRRVPKVRLNWPEHMAVWVCTSEKTLPIAITVLSFLPEEQVGRHGNILGEGSVVAVIVAGNSQHTPLLAQIDAALAAGIAGAAIEGRVEGDAIGLAPSLDTRARTGDHARGFMAHDDRRLPSAGRTIETMNVTATDTTGFHPDENIAGPEFG